MKCDDLEFDIHHFADNEEMSGAPGMIGRHLETCPLCRDELASILSLKRELAAIKAAEISFDRLHRIRMSVRAEFDAVAGFPAFRLIDNNENWLQKWMWPATVGTVTSLVFGALLLGLILVPADVPQLSNSNGPTDPTESSIFLASIGRLDDEIITPEQFANSRSGISQDSPSLNPDGKLVNMTRSDENDEVVVIADVYGNGSAQIMNVIERPRDQKLMDRLIAAFRPDRAAPPFVPASLDNRESLVRVVLKFQSVNVNIDDAAIFR